METEFRGFSGLSCWQMKNLQHLQTSCRCLTKNIMVFLGEREVSCVESEPYLDPRSGCYSFWINSLAFWILYTIYYILDWSDLIWYSLTSLSCHKQQDWSSWCWCSLSSLPWSNPPCIPRSHHHFSEPGTSSFPYVISIITSWREALLCVMVTHNKVMCYQKKSVQS